MEENVTLEIEVEQLLEAGVRAQSAMGQAGRAKGFHVSGLTYPCLRKIQFEYEANTKDTTNHEEGEEEDLEGLWRTWIGTQLHLTPLSAKHEWPLYQEFNVDGTVVQLHGHIDEVLERDDGTMVIIDKKFTGSIPREPYDHHVRQVSHYAALLARQTGAKITHGALLYFCPTIRRWAGQDRIKVYTFPIDVDKAWEELEEKVVQVTRTMVAKQISERVTGWHCGYCKFRVECEALSGPVPADKNGRPLESKQKTLEVK